MKRILLRLNYFTIRKYLKIRRNGKLNNNFLKTKKYKIR